MKKKPEHVFSLFISDILDMSIDPFGYCIDCFAENKG
ncbi:hypothetical protein SAMN05421639_10139 [Chryseobacterium shigense]|uniref:Uncharacterized protein n=1 Tax=Chryseobacterium shigense TaxID=297244 RepID=A0A1N7HTA5_9FLAO|nr:hypothetical protein SAMN05421639_10139 [Chryseobacterium shigense]